MRNSPSFNAKFIIVNAKLRCCDSAPSRAPDFCSSCPVDLSMRLKVNPTRKQSVAKINTLEIRLWWGERELLRSAVCHKDIPGITWWGRGRTRFLAVYAYKCAYKCSSEVLGARSTSRKSSTPQFVCKVHRF